MVWLIAGALLFAWSGVSAGSNSAERNRAKDETAQLAKQEHFYRVVAGELSGNEPGPANKLARDLHDLPVEQIDTFTGDSNRYGGITEDLGFDPFNGVDCSECGPLDYEIALDVIAIKTDQLERVVDDLHAEVKPADTTSGPPTFAWFLWFFSLPTYVGVMYVRQRRGEERKYREFPEERHLLGELRDAQAELPQGPLWDELERLSFRLQEQIETRVEYSKSKTQTMKLESLMQEGSDALEAIAAGNQTLDQ